MDATTIVSLIGALGFGSTAGQWISGSGARRESRGRVLNAVAETEQRRWPSSGSSYAAFDAAVRELQTAALLARVPRAPVDLYEVLARTAYSIAATDDADFDDDTLGGGMDERLHEVIRRSAQMIVSTVWSPYRSRLSLSRKMRQIESMIDGIDDENIPHRIAWFRSDLHGKPLK